MMLNRSETRWPVPRALFLDASGTIFRSDYGSMVGVSVFADAHPLLRAFRNRVIGKDPVKTALITNWGGRVHTILEELALADCFDVVVSGDDVSNGKPSAEPFMLASSKLEVDPHGCLHVGDSLRDDAFAAFDAGLQSIWLNRNPDRVLSREEERMLRMLPHPQFSELKSVMLYLEELFEKESGR